jgi:acetyl-CoA C-acetyltransferase
MTDCFVYDAVRTPRGRGKKDGALHGTTAVELATQVLAAVRDRSGLDTALLDDVVMGCVDPIGEQGADIARAAVLKARFADTVPGTQINRFCASGLEACNIAAGQIMAGQSDLAIGGGVESMSRIPIGASGGAWPADPSVAIPAYFVPQGVSADLIATVEGLSRDDVDRFAVASQQRTHAAVEGGYFKNSLIAVKSVAGKVLLDHDEHPRPDTNMQSLGALKPSFAQFGAMGFDAVAIQRYPQVEAINHVHHAGNSSGIVDGAAAVLLGTKEMGEAMGRRPRARIRAYSSIGSEPAIMLTAPAEVTKKALKRAGMKADDIDLYEVNEAFASVVLRFMRIMKVPHDKLNVNGGAIALGHPLGATGAMLLGTALDELERRNLNTALITLCIGMGMGTATIIERV